jgi:hypothetical protein
MTKTQQQIERLANREASFRGLNPLILRCATTRYQTAYVRGATRARAAYVAGLTVGRFACMRGKTRGPYVAAARVIVDTIAFFGKHI